MKRLRLLQLLFIAIWAPARAADPLQMTFAMQIFPPFISNENGRQSGFFPDTLRAVCAAMRATCTMEVYPWRRAYAMALGGGVDGILMLLNTPSARPTCI